MRAVSIRLPLGRLTEPPLRYQTPWELPPSPDTASLFLGLCISITALLVVIRILMDLKMLNTKLGKTLVAAVITDDVVSLVLLAVILEVSTAGNLVEGLVTSAFILLKVSVLVAALIGVNHLLTRKKGLITTAPIILSGVLSRLKKKESLFAITVLMVLVFAAVTEIMGLHFIVGAFFGSLIFSAQIMGKKQYESVEKTASGMAFGFLAPLFFTYIGLLFSFEALQNWFFLLRERGSCPCRWDGRWPTDVGEMQQRGQYPPVVKAHLVRQGANSARPYDTFALPG